MNSHLVNLYTIDLLDDVVVDVDPVVVPDSVVVPLLVLEHAVRPFQQYCPAGQSALVPLGHDLAAQLLLASDQELPQRNVP